MFIYNFSWKAIVQHLPNATGSVQFSLSVVLHSLQPHGLQHARLPCSSLSLEFSQTRVHWVSNATEPSHPLSLPSLPALNLSQHQDLFQWVALCIRWPKCWSFSFSVSLQMNIQDWHAHGYKDPIKTFLSYSSIIKTFLLSSWSMWTGLYAADQTCSAVSERLKD